MSILRNGTLSEKIMFTINEEISLYINYLQESIVKEKESKELLNNTVIPRLSMLRNIISEYGKNSVLLSQDAQENNLRNIHDNKSHRQKGLCRLRCKYISKMECSYSFVKKRESRQLTSPKGLQQVRKRQLYIRGSRGM